ncbi:ester cyclase [Pseudomonas sp. S25]|uniref:Ester cyclase n=1 Tax=Pseudomonas maioricensis TaxID=1766623 RepID=A0ABS9ZSW1_9PSED|nr:ester cyclase [Pseudomonas sp. S25]MCI8211928.1 ester cyclase [Pseudomonas sp. S25]
MSSDLRDVYRGYIDCLNKQNWNALGQFVDANVHYNDRRVGLNGYREMLERDYREIPDLHFNIRFLIAEPEHIAARLDFACTPIGSFMGLPVNGRKVHFSENVFYRFREGRITEVWSVIDKAAVEAQL